MKQSKGLIQISTEEIEQWWDNSDLNVKKDRNYFYQKRHFYIYWFETKLVNDLQSKKSKPLGLAFY